MCLNFVFQWPHACLTVGRELARLVIPLCEWTLSWLVSYFNVCAFPPPKILLRMGNNDLFFFD